MAYGRGGNDGVLLRRSGKHIRTAHWSASPRHSPLSHSHQHHHPQHTSMSFDDSSSHMDNILGMLHGESSTIPPSHYCHDFRRFSPLFLPKSQAPTHSTSLNHDMFPHSVSYLISCPISLILSFIFFRSFRLEGELGHLGLLGLAQRKTHTGLSTAEQCPTAPLPRNPPKSSPLS